MERKRVLALLVSGLLFAAAGCGDGGSSSSSSGGLRDTASSPPQSSPPAAAAKSPAAVETQPEGWGNLKGTFVYDGAVRQPDPIAVTKDVEYCGTFELVNESLVVNPANGGVANVLVYLYLGRGREAPPVHDSYGASATGMVQLDNNKCRFEPHVCVLTTSQTLQVLNSDRVGHNTKVDTLQNPATNSTIPAGDKMQQQFPRAERMPAAVGCSIHPWMTAWLVVQDHPYAVVSDKDGGFELKNLPAGTWTFQLWQERAGYVSEATVDGKKTEWNKGRMEVTIRADETVELGEIKLPASLFEG